MTAPALRVQVAAITEETPLVKSFRLVPVSGKLPRFSPGSHIATHVPADGGRLTRHYSLAGDPLDRSSYWIAVRRSEVSRGGSAYWHDRVRVGDELDIGWPANHFPLSFEARHHVLIAAGIGITPFMSMLPALKADGRSFELHYAAASAESCAFYEPIRSRYRPETRFYFSERGERMSTQILHRQPLGTHVYLCGPEAMVAQFKMYALSYGYPERSIHYELFAPVSAGPAQPFEAVLARSGRTITVPAHRSLLDALLEAGVDAPYSCRIGGCGSCEVEVAAGEVDHRDFFLTDADKRTRRTIMTCVSRAKSP